MCRIFANRENMEEFVNKEAEKARRGMSEYLLLKIRNLIAAREANTAEANAELDRGGWLSDHGRIDHEIAEEISLLFAQAESEATNGQV